MTAQIDREVSPSMNKNVNTVVVCLREFTRMNSPMFLSNKKEDPQDIIDEVYKIFYARGVNSNEKAELATYQLNNMA